MSDTTQCYITAHSLICNLGDNSSTIAQNVLHLNQENYEAHISDVLNNKPYYGLSHSFATEAEKLYTIVDRVVSECLQKAGLSEEEQKELAVFIGSTAMGVSLNEEAYGHYKNNQSETPFIGKRR